MRATGQVEEASEMLDDLPEPLVLAPGVESPSAALNVATYLDSSAIVKLAVAEDESYSLRPSSWGGG